MTRETELFHVKPGSKVDLSAIDPSFRGGEDKQSALVEIAQNIKRLRELQYLLYSEGRRSLLIVLQGMDASGKDGVINHVLGLLNPQGTRVHSFKVPSHDEAAHHFLWRYDYRVPTRGEVVIFNRSHYEDVLVTRVHDLVPKEVWSKRYDLINDFERNLHEAGTEILKFYLHIDADEQLERFKDRLEDPGRHWKISESDYAERSFWTKYTNAYEDALEKTSTKRAPWFIVPANRNWFRNLTISRIVVRALEALGMELPAPRVDLEEIREKYHLAMKGDRTARNEGAD